MEDKIMFPVSKPYLTDCERSYVMDAFDSTWISSTGKYIDLFEKDFSNYIGSEYGIAMSNGTTALHAALLALDIGEGDEVIVPDLTFAATINIVMHTGATPIIVDINETDWCICTKSIEKAITSKTKAIIPVHLYGKPCNMDEIISIAKIHNLYVIEDCAEAHGAIYKGRKVGSFGDISCFSFFGNKIITTGEGGMCLTNNPLLDEKLRTIRDHGMSKKKKYFHEVVGYNYRMTNIQAAIGVAQLKNINYILAERQKINQLYIDLLKDIDCISFQKESEEIENVNWLFSILLENINRDDVIDRLKLNGIDSRPFFYPLSSMPLYMKFNKNTNHSHIVSKKGLNLPTYIGLEEKDIIFITNTLKTIINEIRC